MTAGAEKLPPSRRWKHRRASKPIASRPTPTPMPIVIAVPATPQLSPYDQARVARWIRDRLIDWPRGRCFHCRGPIVVGQLWIAASSDEGTTSFHQPCHAEWLAQQEASARRALGLDP